MSSSRQNRLVAHDGNDLTPKIPQNERLEQLISSQKEHSIVDLSCQNLNDRDMEIIVQHAVLEKKCKGLNLWGNEFTFESMLVLTDVLNGNETLRELDLSYNRLTDKGVQIISKFLSLNTCLIKEIDLSSNGITDEGVKYICSMLKENKTLTELVLNKNEITNDGLILFADALENDNNTLKRLKVESNLFISRSGVNYVLDTLKDHQTFEELDVKYCSISKKDCQRLEEMALTTGFDVLLRYEEF